MSNFSGNIRVRQSPRAGREIRLARRPDGLPRDGDFEIVTVPIPDLAAGQVLVRNRWISVEPSMRIRMHGRESDYMPPFEIGSVPTGFAVGEVVESCSERFRAGDRVLSGTGWREYGIADGSATGWQGLNPLPLPVGVEERWYLGALGSSGITALMGLDEIAGLRPGDVVFVSAAAGSVGSLAVQIAKARGHHVVASAGDPRKVALVRERLCADYAFSYRDGKLVDHLRAGAPTGIDVYFDNVGGDHLEAALDALRPGGRVAMCGQVSSYNSSEPLPGPRNLFNVTSKALTLRGYLARMFADRVDTFRAELQSMIAAGTVTPLETVSIGLDSTPRAFRAMLAGATLGKTVVSVDSTTAVEPSDLVTILCDK